MSRSSAGAAYQGITCWTLRGFQQDPCAAVTRMVEVESKHARTIAGHGRSRIKAENRG